MSIKVLSVTITNLSVLKNISTANVQYAPVQAMIVIDDI